MKREIKFRGKRIDNKKWVYGFLADEDYINDIDSIDLSSIEVDIDTVCEFTGLLDKNGKEIYEGDIISVNGKYPKLVKYIDDYACFCLANITDLNKKWISPWQQVYPS